MGSAVAVPRRRRARRVAGGRRRWFGESGQGACERARGTRCGTSKDADARDRWGSGVLRCSGHGGGEVAAARSFGGGVVKGGEVQREGRGRRGAGARRVDASAKQRRNWSWPGATQRGGGRRGAVGGEREQRGKLGKKTGT